LGQEVSEWQRANSSGHPDRCYTNGLNSDISIRVDRIARHSGPFLI
jgi:hypothetical protein